MSGRIKVDRSTLAVLREMAEAYMSTQDLGGPRPGVLPSTAVAEERDRRWRRVWMEYERQETNHSLRMVDLSLPSIDVSALDLGGMIDLGASFDQQGTGGQHGRVRRSSRQ
jgi:hypothetical protein